MHCEGWATAIDCPATEIVPVRAGLRFGAAVTCSCAGPAPDADEAESQSAALDTVHGQPASVVTVTAPLPPLAGSVRSTGATE